MWVLYEELLGAPAVSSTNSIPTGFCFQKLWGLISWHWNPGLGGLVWGGTPQSQGYPPDFNPPHVGEGLVCSASVPLLKMWFL